MLHDELESLSGEDKLAITREIGFAESAFIGTRCDDGGASPNTRASLHTRRPCAPIQASACA